ncbi:MAG: transcription factor jumonji jmjC domain-containing protein [Bacteroidetes bacterium]|nr:MAG: transcription factor jumonji jmjC domain-containing protein [Bacteroidota bacterium]
MQAYRDFQRNLTFGQRFKYGVYQIADHFFGRKKLFNKARARYYAKLKASLEKKGPGRIMPIERRKDLSLKEFMNHYVRKGIPVVMEGAAADWDCVKKWSLEYFKELHGKDEIVLVDQSQVDYPYELTTLAHVIDNIRSGGSKYYRFYPLLSRHPEHLEEFDYKWLRDRRTKPVWFDAFQVFIGGAGTYTALHNANQSNLFVQVYGEKKWVLYSHYYTPIIDPAPVSNVYRSAPGKKESGPFNPFEEELDFTGHYELFKYLDGYSVHLKPGDVFWNPPFYWHAVKNPTDSIGVGYRWSSPFYSFKISPLYMTLDCFARNPPIWKAYALYQKDINELHLAEVKRLEEAKQKLAEQEERRKKVSVT